MVQIFVAFSEYLNFNSAPAHRGHFYRHRSKLQLNLDDNNI